MYCRECGFQTKEDDLFCTKCGARILKPPTKTDPIPQKPTEPPTSKSSDSNRPLIIGATTASVIVIITVAIVLILSPFNAMKNTTLTTRVQTKTTENNTAEHESPSESETDSQRESNGSVTLTVKTASGKTLSGTVNRDSNDYVISDSDQRVYSLSELRALDLTDAELCIAWNEPFAAKGYHFSNPDLQAYFESCNWYTDRGKKFSLESGSPGAINNERLRQISSENPSSKRWQNLATG